MTEQNHENIEFEEIFSQLEKEHSNKKKRAGGSLAKEKKEAENCLSTERMLKIVNGATIRDAEYQHLKMDKCGICINNMKHLKGNKESVAL